MKYKVTSEVALNIQGKKFEPGTEVLIAPIHAKPFVEAGQLEKMATSTHKTRKPAKSDTAPESTEK